MATTDRVVVLGGAGFIGRHLVEQLKGHVSSVTVMSRRASSLSDAGVDYAVGNVLDENRVREVVAGATVVYQLTTESDFEAGARIVAEACMLHGVRRLVYASTSDALYLARRGRILEGEGPDPRPDLRNEYSRGKGYAERLLVRYHAEQGLGVVITRPCLVVGRGGQLAHGGIGIWTSPTCCLGWGNGRNPMPFVLVEDVARALFAAMDAPAIEGKAFNLGGDVFLSAREYVDLLARRTQRNFRFRPRSLELLWAEATVRSIVKWLFGGGRGEPQTYRDMKSSQMLTQVDNQQSKEILGWRPNADVDVFAREAIDCHVERIIPGDLRLETGDGH